MSDVEDDTTTREATNFASASRLESARAHFALVGRVPDGDSESRVFFSGGEVSSSDEESPESVPEPD